MKLALAILLVAASLSSAAIIAPAPVPTISAYRDHWQIDFTDRASASNYIWYVECAPSPSGPWDYCADMRYQSGTLSLICPRPNTFYRLRGILNVDAIPAFNSQLSTLN